MIIQYDLHIFHSRYYITGYAKSINRISVCTLWVPFCDLGINFKHVASTQCTSLACDHSILFSTPMVSIKAMDVMFSCMATQLAN